MRRWNGAGLVALLVAAGVGCSSPSSPSVSGESHWLISCTDDEACGGENLSCVCGTCTRACSTDASCNGGACYDTESPLLLQRCEARALEGAGVCLLQCKADGDCGVGRSCESGACIASEFAGVDASVSWSEPVRDSPAELTISDLTSDKLGTWRQPDCDTASFDWCFSVILERGPSDQMRGFWRAESTRLRNGFAPASDAELGYPREVPPSEYGQLYINVQAGVSYRFTNARLVGDELSFQWSMFEPWRDWCAMQTPYAWQVGERTFYFCVPQDEQTWSGIDLGKVELCRSAEFMELCTDKDGGRTPCVCQDPTDPLCSFNVCACNAQSCGLPTAGESWTMHFEPDGQTAMLTVRESPMFGSNPIVHLERVKP